MIDLLLMLHNGNISLDESYKILDSTLHNIHEGKLTTDWAENLGMSRYEGTALIQGVGLEGLLLLRYQGWPEKCSKFGQPLDYKQFGWRLIREEGQSLKLIHLTCPSP